MRNLSTSCRCILAMLLCAGGAGIVRAEDAPAKTPAPAANAAAANPAPVKFRPVIKGAPSVRVTGGSRGTGESSVTLDVLAPDETGITTQEQPSLFWYQSKPANAKFELTLLQDNKVKPLVQVKIERSTKAGIQRLKLSDYNAKLTPGVEYQWVVALVTDSDNRSKDLVASGLIKRIEPDADLKTKLSSATAASKPGIYAEAGIWYDALSLLSDEIDANPGDQALRRTRADLLTQVGLKTAANSELASK
jgi:hypothetical protein